MGQRQGFGRGQISSQPQTHKTANHAAEGGNPKARGGVWRKETELWLLWPGVCAQPGELAGLSQRGGAVRGQRQIGSDHNVSGKSTDNMDALKVLLAQRLTPNRPKGARPQVWEGLLPSPSLASLPSKSSGSPSGFHFSSLLSHLGL